MTLCETGDCRGEHEKVGSQSGDHIGALAGVLSGHHIEIQLLHVSRCECCVLTGLHSFDGRELEVEIAARKRRQKVKTMRT